MTVSPDDRRRMAALARDLVALETDAEPDQAGLERAVRAADADRERAGRPPLDVSGPADLPEEGFYRRARALGFRRIRR